MKRSGFKRPDYQEFLERVQSANARPRVPLKRGRIKRGATRLKPKRTLYAGKMWSEDVKTRDDYTCQRCGKYDKHNNHAHHIAPRSRRPDLKFNRSNGITLCPLCHRWVHDNPILSTEAGLLSDATYEAAQKAKCL